MLARMTRLNLTSTATLLLFIAFSGCDRGDGTGTASTAVSGHVSLDGQPVPDAKIVFVPLRLYDNSGDYQEMAYATTDAQGNFTLKTASGKTGVGCGLHRVVVSKRGDTISQDDRFESVGLEPFSDPGDGFRKLAGEEIPAIYNLHSILTFNVESTANPVRANFDLSSVDPLLKR